MTRYIIKATVGPGFLCLVILLATLSAIGISHPARAQQTSLTIPNGLIGAQGTNVARMLDIRNFSTLGITVTYFMAGGTYGGTQGNDGSIVLRVIDISGTAHDIFGAINWRITRQGALEYIGFIPDPGAPSFTLQTNQGPYPIGEMTNYALQMQGSSLFFPDGSDVSGNAANSGTFTAAEPYLVDFDAGSPVITGPSGGPGALSSMTSVPEGTIPVFRFLASEAASWSISGTDAAFFVIDPATGALSFIAPLDYESPLDAGADNVYEIVVHAVDGEGNASYQVVSIVVTDIVEPDISVSKVLDIVESGLESFDCAADPPVPEADLVIPGACVEYTITVQSASNGSAPVDALVITDVLPATVEVRSARIISGFDSLDLSGNTVTGEVGVLAPGQSASFAVRALVR